MSDDQEPVQLRLGEVPEAEHDEPQPILLESGRPASAVMYSLGGQLNPLKFEPRCNTCCSPFRQWIEKKLLHGYSYGMVQRSLGDAGLTVDGIRGHVDRGHFPLREYARRVVIEERAREIARDVEQFEHSLVDNVTFARVGLQRTFERLVDGELQPNLRDGIRFARLLHDLGLSEEHALDIESTREMFFAYMDAASAVMSTEQMAEFSTVLTQHPTMRAWMQAHVQSSETYQLDEGDIVEAEDVEEDDEEDDGE